MVPPESEEAATSPVIEPPARIVETHISVLFFFGDRVVKLRRPVAYSFVDFTDLERRRADCEREVLLNRRLAPDVYLGTATVSMGGRPVEYAVVMRRLPDERNLSRLVRSGAPVEHEVRRIASALADFHRGAGRSPRISAAGTSTALWQRWQATEEDLGRFVGPVVDPDGYGELTALALRFLRGRRPLFDRRIEEGAVCDGHGDLQAADIFCLEDAPRMLDCLEFDDELRYGDVLADVAFLAADLERLGAPDAAAALVREYAWRSGRAQPAALVHFYVAFRAHIRLLVENLAAERDGSDASGRAGELLHLALVHLRAAQPRVVLVGGLPGTGKSTLSTWLGSQLGAEVLSSDQLRREPVPAHGGAAPPGPGRYSDEARAAVYSRLCGRAAGLLAMGTSVVLDATWTSATMRAMAADLARSASADLVELRCDCPPAERAARIGARRRAGSGDSEATAAVADALGAAEDPWPAAHRVDTSGSPEQSRASATAALEAAGCPVPRGRRALPAVAPTDPR